MWYKRNKTLQFVISSWWRHMSIMASRVIGNSVLCSKVCSENISNHQHLDCLLSRFFRHTRNIIRDTGLYEANPSVTGGFSSQRASNAENVCTMVRVIQRPAVVNFHIIPVTWSFYTFFVLSMINLWFMAGGAGDSRRHGVYMTSLW